jgi:hypothetical protein
MCDFRLCTENGGYSWYSDTDDFRIENRKTQFLDVETIEGVTGTRDHLVQLTNQCYELIRLKPEHEASYRKQLEDASREVNEKRHSLIVSAVENAPANTIYYNEDGVGYCPMCGEPLEA